MYMGSDSSRLNPIVLSQADGFGRLKNPEKQASRGVPPSRPHQENVNRLIWS